MNKSEPEQTFAMLISSIESEEDANAEQQQTIYDDEENVQLATVGDIKIASAYHQFINQEGRICTYFYAELTCGHFCRDFTYAVYEDDQWKNVNFDLMRKAERFVQEVIMQNRASEDYDYAERIPSCFL